MLVFKRMKSIKYDTMIVGLGKGKTLSSTHEFSLSPQTPSRFFFFFSCASSKPCEIPLAFFVISPNFLGGPKTIEKADRLTIQIAQKYKKTRGREYKL